MPPINLTDYPPPFSEERGQVLEAQIQDWQINHGSLVKLIGAQAEPKKALAHPIGVSVFPTPFPETRFKRALELQPTFNELYCAVASDGAWIYEAIQDLLPIDPLAEALWRIYEEVQETGYAQDVSVGIFRSDYMLHGTSGALKQVEFNTYSCAGGAHANRVVDMHRYLTRIGAYELPDEDNTTTSTTRGDIPNITLSALPENNNITSLASCLADAHLAYGSPRTEAAARETAVLFVVQPHNFNIADERPIEYNLWEREPPIPAYRVEFGADVLQYTTLTDTRELLFHPPWLGPANPVVEISVVYLRAGYETHEYDPVGRKARLQLERSRAIKCPSILAHIATFKKIQQALVAPGALERFLPEEKAAAVRSTFVPMYPLDESDAGRHARKLALDPRHCVDYILKPSLEGGGHNIFGEDIPRFLASIPEAQWSAYILMERIPSPEISNVLMSPTGTDLGPVISELGIFGTCMWRKGTGEDQSGSELLKSSVAGWSLKTKHAEVNEMSVVKGYGCFDTPLLI